LNRRQVPRLVEVILSHLEEGATAGVLGLAYKPNTDVIEESQGVAIAQALLDAGARVAVYDPAAMESAKRVLAGNVIFAASAAECVQWSDVLAITTPWAEFQDLPPAAFQRRRGSITVLDCWRVLPETVTGLIGAYLTPGRGRSTVVQLDGGVLAGQGVTGFDRLLE
jgi:UDPglucose 6-dehydrogenase